jgi:hypothetical protein
MTQYAHFDHTAAAPALVLGWYDTALFEYPNLPDAADLLLLTTDQWAARLSQQWGVQSGALVPYVPPTPPPPTVQQQALALLGQPVAVQSTSMPALDASYPIDQITQGQITGIAAAINAGLGLPGDGPTFNWPDATGTPHQWPALQFTFFAKAVMNYVYACAQVAQGHGTTLPGTTLTIP